MLGFPLFFHFLACCPSFSAGFSWHLTHAGWLVTHSHEYLERVLSSFETLFQLLLSSTTSPVLPGSLGHFPVNFPSALERLEPRFFRVLSCLPARVRPLESGGHLFADLT